MATFLERYQDLGAITDIGADTLFAVTKGADSTVPPPVSGVARGDALLAYMSANFQANIATVNGLQSALDGKAAAVHTHDISQITGTVAYTQAEKDKLAGVESSKFLGLYTTLAALNTAHPTATPGQYAHVDAGVGDDVKVYIWDDSDSVFVEQAGASVAETPASIKSKYESNPDTNAFTDADKTKLDAVLVGAALEALIDARIAASGGPPATPAAQITNNPASQSEMAGFLLQGGMGPTPQSGF